MGLNVLSSEAHVLRNYLSFLVRLLDASANQHPAVEPAPLARKLKKWSEPSELNSW